MTNEASKFQFFPSSNAPVLAVFLSPNGATEWFCRSVHVQYAQLQAEEAAPARIAEPNAAPGAGCKRAAQRYDDQWVAEAGDCEASGEVDGQVRATRRDPIGRIANAGRRGHRAHGSEHPDHPGAVAQQHVRRLASATGSHSPVLLRPTLLGIARAAHPYREGTSLWARLGSCGTAVRVRLRAFNTQAQSDPRRSQDARDSRAGL
eukprot:scaffold22820_cov61-Phaeocystis_antarctica.AAC.6